VVGTADAGESGKVQWFTSADEARKKLSGGDLPLALEMMFSPAPEGGGGASLVGVIVANTTVRSSFTGGGLTVTSKEYGEGGNRAQFKLEDGTLAGSKKFTAYRWDTEQMEVFDNLGAIMKVQYTGTAAFAGLTVTVSAGKAVTLEIKVGVDQASAVTDVSLDLTNSRFSTVDLVIKYLNSLSNYDASYVDYKNSDLPSSKLDAVSNSPIKAGGIVKGVEGDVEFQLGRYSTLVDVDVTGTLTNTTDFVYLSGGSKGTTPSSWAPYFDTIKKNFSDILVVLSASEPIHAEAAAHVAQMELRNQKQVLFTGGDVAETTDRTKQRAAMLNSSRVVLAYPGVYHKSFNEGKSALAPYFTSAMLAGRVAGVDASEPITFDYFNLVALERDLVAGDPEIDDLNTSGVATLERVQNGGIRLVQGVTTYIGTNNTLYREISVRRGADKLASTLRKAMEDAFVGKKGLRATTSAVETKAISVLEKAKMDGEILDYRNIVVRFVDTIVYVDYEVAPIEPINFVLITSHFVPDFGTAV
jgi:hypothetical protein